MINFASINLELNLNKIKNYPSYILNVASYLSSLNELARDSIPLSPISFHIFI